VTALLVLLPWLYKVAREQRRRRQAATAGP
jgi:hypothetical protein